MFDNLAVDRLEDAINDVRTGRLAASEPSPELRAERRILWQQHEDTRRLILEITAEQKKAWRAQFDWQHELLADVTADLFSKLKLPEYEPTDFPDVVTARQAQKVFLERLQKLRSLYERIRVVTSHDNQPPEQKALTLCHTLYARVVQLEAQLSELRSASPKKSTRSKLSRGN